MSQYLGASMKNPDSTHHYEYLDEFKIILHLGSGSSAEVKLAHDEEGNEVAIKKYKNKPHLHGNLMKELSIMEHLHHQNIIKLISVREHAMFRPIGKDPYDCFAIIMEYGGGGELFDFVAETGKFSEKVARTYFHQLINALHYLNKEGYAHRDLKPQNMLLSKDFTLKVADFGFSCLLKGHDGSGRLHTKLGTQGYMAPEIKTGEYDGRKVDIFAAGVILFIMYSGSPPFETTKDKDPYYSLVRTKSFHIFWEAHSRNRPHGYFGHKFKRLIEKLVAHDPLERPSTFDLIKDPWMNEPICTHKEVIEEFTERKSRLEVALQVSRMQEEIRSKNESLRWRLEHPSLEKKEDPQK